MAAKEGNCPINRKRAAPIKIAESLIEIIALRQWVLYPPVHSLQCSSPRRDRRGQLVNPYKEQLRPI